MEEKTKLSDTEGGIHLLTEEELSFMDDRLCSTHWKIKHYRVSLTFPIAGLLGPYVKVFGGTYFIADVWFSGFSILVAYLWMRNTYEDNLKRTFAFFWGIIMIVLPFIDSMYLLEHKIMLWAFGSLYIVYWFRRGWMKKIVLTPELLYELKKFRAGEVDVDAREVLGDTPEPVTEPQAKAVFCSKCGVQAPVDSAFCAKCGSKLLVGSPKRTTA